MLNLEAKTREERGKKVKNLRKKGIVPGVLYGPKTETLPLEVSLKEFEKVYQAAGETSLVQLSFGAKKFLVLIHAVEIDAISRMPLHVDFYQPRLDEEITAEIPLVFEGEAPAVKDLGGTLVKNIHTVEVRALPQNLPHEIRVTIEKLKTFEDAVSIKDLIIPAGVKILKEQESIIALVTPIEKVEEELAKPVEEKVEEVEKVEKEKKEEVEEIAEEKPAAEAPKTK